ncbi:MAG: hypothetical protein V3W41_19070 [Planctomycetota bacterium]
MTTLQAAEIWNALLAEKRALHLDHLPGFRSELLERGVHFGGRPLCNHLRPKFLTEAEVSSLAAVAEATMAGIVQAKERMLEDPALMALLNLTEVEREMVQPDPGYSYIAPCVRLDSFMTHEGPKFVEINGECPAGVGFGDRLSESFLKHPLAEEFQRTFSMRMIPTLPPMLDALLTCWGEFSGAHKPTIAIVDYRDVPTAIEFEICRDHFEAQGYRTIIVDPRELEFDGHSLEAQGEKIDVVYKRVLMNEFIEKLDEVKPLFDAYRAGRVCVVNPFQAKLVHKKSIFAVLTADNRESWMDDSLCGLIDSAVPWTRNLVPGKTNYRGESVDLIPFLRERREHFVLKPNDDYGGKGISLGWEIEEDAWSRALDAAVGNDFVAQERIILSTEPFPSMANDLEPDDLFVDLDPYLFMGKMVGALARLGVGGLCNVTSGGGQVPLFIVGEKRCRS